MTIYMPGLIEMMLPALLVLIVSSALAIFSPFGIGFIIFSILRGLTKSEKLKKTSFVIQIILIAITFVIGTLTSLFFSINNSPFYVYDYGFLFTLAVIMGVSLSCTIGIIVIIWQSHALRNNVFRK